MNRHQKTWITFIAMLSALSFPKVATAHAEIPETETPLDLEQRLTRIAVTLKDREAETPRTTVSRPGIEIAGWLKGGRRGFLNNPGGGGFLNRRWGDGGGFLNRR